jgi:hypothetical protein
LQIITPDFARISFVPHFLHLSVLFSRFSLWVSTEQTQSAANPIESNSIFGIIMYVSNETRRLFLNHKSSLGLFCAPVCDKAHKNAGRAWKALPGSHPLSIGYDLTNEYIS